MCDGDYCRESETSPSGAFLEEQETNQHDAVRSNPCVAPSLWDSPISFRHSGWWQTRARIRRALQQADAGRNRLQRWDACGAACWILKHADRPGEYRLAAAYCHDRFCRPCGQARSATIARNLADAVPPGRIRFLTLTYNSPLTDLRAIVKALFADFGKMRRSADWKSHVTGGALFLEIKWNAAPGRWHVHLHCLIQGSFWQQTDVADLWRRITTHSFIVDIRSPAAMDKIVAYVAKYVTKSIDNHTTTFPDRLCEAVGALAGTRTFTTFGRWRGLNLNARLSSEGWEPYAPLDVVLKAANLGQRHARELLQSIRRYEPWHTLSDRQLQLDLQTASPSG